MRRNNVVTVAAAAVVVIAVAVIGARIGAVMEPEGDEEVIVVMKTIGPHMEFWQIVRAGIQEAATEYDIEPAIVGPRWERRFRTA